MVMIRLTIKLHSIEARAEVLRVERVKKPLSL
jgi:hypothetical protein